MKKVININFQGRVIPIEEPAYEMLQKYISSLRNYFANEEGRDEIINDIENRIGELFAEQLKKGSPCITDEDVNAIIVNMGRPDDFAAAEEATATNSEKKQDTSNAANDSTNAQYEQRKRLRRNEADKILGGVCSGLADHLNIDPAIIRVLFALTAFFGGFGFLIYIVLWIALPGGSYYTNVRKRLYRDSENKVIAGVCGGLGKYFDINPAVPRIIFAAPFIFGLITSIGRHFFLPWPVFIGGFSGGTFILTYIILWIVLPEAVTASEKLEMKGEKVDLNSIRNTVMSDLHGFKSRAQKIGEEMKESFTEAGKAAGERGRAFREEVRDTAHRHGRGLGHAILILLKAFIIFIGACIGLALFATLIALLGAGVGVMPLKDFLLDGIWQNVFAWGALLFFIGVPIIGFIVWLIRRLMRVRTRNRYISYVLSILWVIGLVSFIFLIAGISKSFRSFASKREDVTIVQPSTGKLYITVANNNRADMYDDWFGVDFGGAVNIDKDSLYLNTVRLNVVRSEDSLYHIHLIKMSRGRTKEQASELMEKINFPIVQQDSIIRLPEDFIVIAKDKWRNQRVLVVVEVPVGKKIKVDDRVNDYNYFSIQMGRNHGWNRDWERNWDNGMYWEDNEDMIMTPDNLAPADKKIKKSKRLSVNKNGVNIEENEDSPEDNDPASP